MTKSVAEYNGVMVVVDANDEMSIAPTETQTMMNFRTMYIAKQISDGGKKTKRGVLAVLCQNELDAIVNMSYAKMCQEYYGCI